VPGIEDQLIAGHPMPHTHEMAARINSRSVGSRQSNVVPTTTGRICRIIPALLVTTGLMWASTAAQAGTIVNVTFQGQDPNAAPTSGRGVRLYDSLNASGTPNSSAVANFPLYEAGAFDFKVNNLSSTEFLGSGGTASSNGILSFCIEMTDYIQYGPTNLTMIPLANGPAQVSGPNVNGRGATSAMFIDDLWGQHINTVLDRPAGLTTSQAAGVFQLAVRKLEYDSNDPCATSGSVNFGKGYVDATAHNSSDAAILNTASNGINSLSLNPASGDLARLVAISGANYQDQVSQVVTPEPSSNLIWLVLAAIGVYPIMRRRNRAA
jgi:hypothetical protein